MIVEGFANIYREMAGRYRFDYSIFVYPSKMLAEIRNENSDGSDRVGQAVPIKIEIPDKKNERKK